MQESKEEVTEGLEQSSIAGAGIVLGPLTLAINNPDKKITQCKPSSSDVLSGFCIRHYSKHFGIMDDIKFGQQ